MDKKLYLSIVNCFQQTSFNFLALQQAFLSDVKWMENPTHTKPLHKKKTNHIT